MGSKPSGRHKKQYYIGVWCKGSHGELWTLKSRFESWYPSEIVSDQVVYDRESLHLQFLELKMDGAILNLPCPPNDFGHIDVSKVIRK